MTDFMKKGDDAQTAYEKASGQYGRVDDAVKNHRSQTGIKGGGNEAWHYLSLMKEELTRLTLF